MPELKFTKATPAKFATIKDGDKIIASIFNLGDNNRENKLAAMFAAAPEMLQTLQDSKTVLEAGGDITDLLRSIDKAITQATTVHNRAKK